MNTRAFVSGDLSSSSRRPSDLDGPALHLFTLNISGPSVDRAERLLTALDQLDPEVLVLTETRNNAGTRLLLDTYRERKYTVLAPMPDTSGGRGVAVVHRLPAGVPSLSTAVEFSERIVVCRIGGDRPLTLVGVYVPSRDASEPKIRRKKVFLTQMTSLLQGLPLDDNVVVLGDLNILSRSHVPRYPAFRCWEYDALEAITATGLVDAFALLNPGVQAHSWIGRNGAGYRYDYGFVSESLVDRLRACDYVHDFRLAGLSDHAGVVVALDHPGVRRGPSRNPISP